jgi:hybrid cluster-associated redox disulfide protein
MQEMRAFLFPVICASAKRDFSQSCIFGAMDTPAIPIHLTVDEVLQRWPRAFSIFMRNKTKCPGCFMQHFCTLKDVAETYQISPEELVAEIKNVSEELS